MTELIQDAQADLSRLVEIRHRLHMHPEISQQEKNTAEYIKAILTQEGIPFSDHLGGYGIVAVISGETPGKTVGLRADMDALQIQELTDVSYQSQNEGVMHACGHDVHMTFLLGAARLLNSRKHNICGTVKLIFQPAEELSPVGGSQGVLHSGTIDDLDAIFGMHVWPELPHGVVGVRDGAMMAASDHFYIEIKGQSSHAAQPHNGVDAVVAGAQLVSALQTLISRETDPLDAAVLTIGKMNAGTRYNVVADTCLLEGTCRTFSEATRNRIEQRMQQLVDDFARSFQCTGHLNYQRGYLSVVNNKELAELARRSAAELFTTASVNIPDQPSTGGEDFSFYLQNIPGAFLWMGTGKDEATRHPIHNGNFNVNEDILWRGAALFSQIAMDFLNGNLSKANAANS